VFVFAIQAVAMAIQVAGASLIGSATGKVFLSVGGTLL
jgi:hypothetical protein